MDKFSNHIQDYDQEYCGLILKDGSVVSVNNSHPSPVNNFQILEKDIIPYLDDIDAIWHSHIKDDPNLSIDDYHCFMALPEHRHIIVTQREIAVYRVDSGYVLNVSRTPRNVSNT